MLDCKGCYHAHAEKRCPYSGYNNVCNEYIAMDTKPKAPCRDYIDIEELKKKLQKDRTCQFCGIVYDTKYNALGCDCRELHTK